MAQKYVGIDLGSQRVKIAVISAGLRGAQVLDLFEEPVPPAPHKEDGTSEEPDPYLAPLQAALTVLRSRGLLTATMGVALPASVLSYRLLGFPFADERRIAQAIAFEAEGEFPLPLDQLAHGHAVVPGPPNGGRALLVAARRDRVEQVATIFKRAGAELKAVTSGATALAAVVEADPGPTHGALSEQNLQPVSLVIDLGHTTTVMVAVGSKGPMAVRTIRRAGRHVTEAVARAYALDQGAAEAAKIQDGFVAHRGHGALSEAQLHAAAVVAGALEPVVREVEHTRMWLRATYRLEVVRVVLCGGGARLRGLSGYLAEHLGLPVADATLRPGAGLRRSAARELAARFGEGTELLEFFPALGAALGAARRPAIQLHDDMAEHGDGSWIQERISSLAMIGMAVLGFGAIDTIVRVKAIEAERAAWAGDLSEATQKLFGTPVPAPEVKRRLDAAEGQDLLSLMPERGALEVLAQLSQAVRPSDLGRVPAPGAAVAVADDAPPGEDSPDGSTDDADTASESGAAAASGETFDLKQGVVVSDDLTLQVVDIRERKIELKLEAARASAQDRVAYRLRDIACLSNIEKGKVKGEARKVFEMTMDNNCYFASSLGTGDEVQSSDEDEGS